MRHTHTHTCRRNSDSPTEPLGAPMLMLSGGFDFSQPLRRSCSVWQPRCSSPPHFGKKKQVHWKKKKRSLSYLFTTMDETDIMDLTHQKARKRPRPISSSADESVHASLKRMPIRAAECRDNSSLMFSVRGEPVHAAALKQNNDHHSSVNSSPNTVMPAQVKTRKVKVQRCYCRA